MKEEQTFDLFTSVAVFGSADITENEYQYDQSFRLSAALAEAGLKVVNGGGPGVMQGATEGAESVGGDTLAITFEPKDAPFFEGRATTNQADKEIKTKNYPERLLALIDHSDAFVCMKGGTGTLSEWATVWLMAHIYYGKHKPFVLVGEFWQEIVDAVTKNMFVEGPELKVFRIVRRVDQVVPALLELEQELLDLQERIEEEEMEA